MAVVKFAHAADLHLDSPLRGLDRYEGAPVERMRAATRRAFTNLVDACIAEPVDFLLVVGDLFDGNWKDYGTGLFFASQMSRLREAKIPVVFLRGNHDAASHVTKQLRLPDNVRELSWQKPETFELAHLGVAIHGQGFGTRAMTDDLAARYPQAIPGLFNIGLLHTCAEGREGHDRYAPTTVPILASKGYDYWALGHVHEREVLSRDPWIVFPGNIQGRHARETGAKGATIVTVLAGRVTDVEHRAFDVARWSVCNVDASGAASAADVIDLVREALRAAALAADGRPLAARVLVSGTTPAHLDLVGDQDRYTNEVRAAGNDLEGDGVWVEKVTFHTRAPLDAESLRERDDAIGQLARSLADLRADEAAMRLLFDELADLKKKLPIELRDAEGSALPEDAAGMRDVLDDVEGLLLPRLLSAPKAPAARLVSVATTSNVGRSNGDLES